ncbi:MAG TPA: hypothetical protein ENK06_00625 [Gammaproteobacteria bacterium]|nr:hypothetical protein [Gammaproteobacteria bacterium]
MLKINIFGVFSLVKESRIGSIRILTPNWLLLHRNYSPPNARGERLVLCMSYKPMSAGMRTSSPLGWVYGVFIRHIQHQARIEATMGE